MNYIGGPTQNVSPWAEWPAEEGTEVASVESNAPEEPMAQGMIYG